MTGTIEEAPRQSLDTSAARNLATTTKTEPRMQGISPRWLLRVLPWEEATAGSYRVNRRLSHTIGDGRVTFTNVGADIRVIPAELGELAPLRGFTDEEVLTELAARFERHEYEPGAVLAEFGHEADRVFLVAHGKVARHGAGKYGDQTTLGTLADGDQFGARVLVEDNTLWDYTARAVTPVIALTLSRQAFTEVADRSATLRDQLRAFTARQHKPRNAKGEAEIALASGHGGEPELPATFVDYETTPREYELSVAQTVLRVHTRVADLYNKPMDQLDQQLKLTIEALRERQEHELVNNREFGLLHNADLSQRIHTRTGPPTPDDFDDLLCRRRKTRYLLAHPKTIAAFGRECTARGLYPVPVTMDGREVTSWRGVPLLPCDKIPVSDRNTSAVLAMRTGLADSGVIGLRQTGIPDEYEPGLNVRFMGVSDKAIVSYLVSTYYSAAVLVPDALGILENVELGRATA